MTWTVEDITHNVTFESADAPDDIPDIQNTSASRTFPTSGSFMYHCTIHPVMVGTVRVH